MAQILVFDRDNTHADPAVDKAGCYKIGDIVVVKDDEHVWGALETQYPFRVVSVPGPVEKYAHFSAVDEQKKIPKSVLRSNVLRRLALKEAPLTTTRRRRYRYAGNIESKHHA